MKYLLFFRKSEFDDRGHLHVRTVSSEQKFGHPVAGNYFYLDMAAGNLRNQNTIKHRYKKINTGCFCDFTVFSIISSFKVYFFNSLHFPAIF